MIREENMHISDITWTQQVIFNNIYKFIHTCNNNFLKGHKFKGEHGRIFGKAWRVEREGGNIAIKLQFQKAIRKHD